MVEIIWKIIIGIMAGAVIHMIWNHVERMRKKEKR